MKTFTCKTCGRTAALDFDGECSRCFVGPDPDAIGTDPTDDELVARFEADMGVTLVPMGTVATETETGHPEATAIFGVLSIEEEFRNEVSPQDFDF